MIAYLAFKFDMGAWHNPPGADAIEADDQDEALEAAREQYPDAESVAVVPVGNFYIEAS